MTQSSEQAENSPTDRLPDRVVHSQRQTPTNSREISFQGSDSLAFGETPSSPTAQKSFLGKLQLDVIADSLSHRDRAVLASLRQHRFLTTRHLERWHFADHKSRISAARTCRRVLARLRDWKLLTTLERRLGGIRAGSTSYTWHLSHAGSRLIRNSHDGNKGGRIREPSLAFLQHELGIAETHLGLIETARTGQIDLIDVTTEPACWRTFLGSGGQPITLKPDLFAITAHGDSETLFFAEYDRGSESIQTIVKKALVYEVYRNSGLEQQRSGVYPYVLWIVPSTQRKQRIVRALGSAAIRQPELHLVATYDETATIITKTSQEGGDQ